MFASLHGYSVAEAALFMPDDLLVQMGMVIWYPELPYYIMRLFYIRFKVQSSESRGS